MNKKITLIVCLLLQVTLIFAQKVDLDSKKLKHSYYKMPTEQVADVADNEHTFSVKVVNIDPNVSRFMTSQSITKLVEIDGLNRVNKDGRILLELRLTEFNETERKVNTISMANIVSYVAQIRFKAVFTCTAIDTKSMKTITTKLNGTTYTDYNHRTATHDNRNAAQNELNGATQEVVVKSYIQKFILECNAELTTKLGYIKTEEEHKFYAMDAEKHPENAQFNKEFAKLTAIVAKCNIEQTNMNAVSEEAKPVLAYLEAMPAKYALDDKQHRKIRYAGWYNAALLNYVLDNFDEAIKLSQKVIDNKYDDDDGKKLLKKCQEAKVIQEASKTKYRHFALSWKKQNEEPEADPVVVVAPVVVTPANVNASNNNKIPEFDFTLINIPVAFTDNSGKEQVGIVAMNRVLILCMEKIIFNTGTATPDIPNAFAKPGSHKFIKFPADAPAPFAGAVWESVRFLKATNTSNLPEKYFVEKFITGKIDVYKTYDVYGKTTLGQITPKAVLEGYVGTRERYNLQTMVIETMQGGMHLVRKGDGNAKYIIDIDMEKLLKDKPELVAKFKVNTTIKKRSFLDKVGTTMGDRTAKDITPAELALRLALIKEYNE